MQLPLLDLGEDDPPPGRSWEELTDEQQAEVVASLARLIAKLAAGPVEAADD